MTKTSIFLTATLFAFALSSCSKPDDDNNNSSEDTTVSEVSINATSSTAWNYYSFAEDKVVGSADESEENNAVWAARKDWDIAIRRYNIRTNSGEFTSVNAKGGVYTFDKNTSFASVSSLPNGARFVEDKIITSTGMGGSSSVIRSEATVILFKENEDGSLVMPPVYLPAPVYIFRTADGNHYYKVEFTQYKDENDVAGHVKFNRAKVTEK